MPAKSQAALTRVTEPRFSSQDQSWCYQVEHRHTKSGKVLRVSIRRNAYDGQSYKRVLVFDLGTSQWNVLLDSVLTSADKCAAVSYVVRELTSAQKELFVADGAALLVTAGVILDAAC